METGAPKGQLIGQGWQTWGWILWAERGLLGAARSLCCGAGGHCHGRQSGTCGQQQVVGARQNQDTWRGGHVCHTARLLRCVGLVPGLTQRCWVPNPGSAYSSWCCDAGWHSRVKQQPACLGWRLGASQLGSANRGSVSEHVHLTHHIFTKHSLGSGSTAMPCQAHLEHVQACT